MSWVLIVGLIAGAIVLMLLFVLVSLVFGRRRAVQKRDRQEMERFKAEEVEANRIAEREKSRIAEMVSQRQYAQPAGTATSPRLPVSDLRCPNCHEAIAETDTYCSNCRYLLSPSASGLHRFATPPVPPQAQLQGANAAPHHDSLKSIKPPNVILPNTAEKTKGNPATLDTLRYLWERNARDSG